MIDALQKKFGIKNIALINNIIVKEINRTKGNRKNILEVSYKILPYTTTDWHNWTVNSRRDRRKTKSLSN